MTPELRQLIDTALQHLPADGIGVLHIDGNHDIEFVAKDLQYYLPKIKSNGPIIMDDTDWDSVRSCLPLLAAQCKLESEHGTWQVWRKA
ncbi:class I SAM-dependent methyltransferase [Pseudoduganella aquatica]|uniref:class I SAM-dependent methyltransferase n=1 Tax=Pseudoduganella aquatica TaxID=2660641 RepID=UPI001E37DF82|nr:class I SAM-dependent methyltransferase [Pseudoduganella aquatica]